MDMIGMMLLGTGVTTFLLVVLLVLSVFLPKSRRSKTSPKEDISKIKEQIN